MTSQADLPIHALHGGMRAADAAAAPPDTIGRINQLLQSIVAGTRALLDAADFEPALNDWLKMMCEAQGAISASYYDSVIHAETGLQTARLLADWDRINAPGRVTASFADPMIFDPRGYELVFAAFAQGKTFALHTADLDGSAREIQAAQGHATTISTPIMDGPRWIGAVSFDYWERKELNAEDDIVLRAAADALASVLKRNQVQARLVAEQQARAEEQARLADMLQSVVQSSRELVEEKDFEAGINRWLATLGEKTEAARATYYDTVGQQGSPEQQMRVLAEWSRPGVGGSMQTSFEAPIAVPFDHASDEWRAMMANRPHVFDLATCSIEMRHFLEAQGNKTVLAVPFLVGGQTHAVSFDFLEHRTFDQRSLAILQTAAHSIAAEIDRRRSDEARLDAERQRALTAEAAAADLTRRKLLLEAVVAASSEFLRAASIADVGDKVVERIGRAMGLDRSVIARIGPIGSDSTPWFRLEHEWTADGIPRQMDDPSLRLLDVSPYEEFLRGLRLGQPVTIVTEELTDPVARAEQEATGAKSQFQFPIMVDGELWGIYGGDNCTKPHRFDEVEVATIALTAAAIGNLITRENLQQARIDAERELADEKSRMAREIHDGLAQSFAGVVMQIHATEDALEARDIPDAEQHMARALDRARMGLSEARRSVYTQRPPMLENGDLSAALKILVARIFDGVPAKASFRLTGEAAPLSEMVAIELFRIAQEALNNAIRHSAAKTVQVRLCFEADDIVALAIEDDGIGMDLDAVKSLGSGFGLVSMRERAARMNGNLDITSSPGAGTRVTVQVRRERRVPTGDVRAILPLIEIDVS